MKLIKHDKKIDFRWRVRTPWGKVNLSGLKT